jgi:succinate dehydrogenase flavin-adding protein (antitoxin of CptAB toxin-antitoxin module)
VKRKPIRTFIKENRAELDEIIRRMVPNLKSLNDDDRYSWILNHESLYQWARSQGVNI